MSLNSIFAYIISFLQYQKSINAAAGITKIAKSSFWLLEKSSVIRYRFVFCLIEDRFTLLVFICRMDWPELV